MEQDPGPTDAALSVTQSRLPGHLSIMSMGPISGEGELFTIGPRLQSQHRTRPYNRSPDDPLYRSLSIFALDPSVSKLQGAIAKVDLPYEPLRPGPEGAVLRVAGTDKDGHTYPPAALDNPKVLVAGGYVPSTSRPEFHQQMVYAVAMNTYNRFRLALGRSVSWAFTNGSADATRLTLRPFGAEEANAWYDSERGEVVFGYFSPKCDTPVAPAKTGTVYTCLSHDIIVHEMSHALLDGLRAHFLYPSHPDVPAFHEAFADLVALFEHFTHKDAVRSALAENRGELTSARPLVSLANEFGHGLGSRDGVLRSFVALEKEIDDNILTYADTPREPHERAKVLAYAVFDAFIEIYRRRTRRFIKLATNERGVLPDGDLPETLEDLLVEEVQKVAQQFSNICIRAIDYCPPIDVRFGDYLRALITADRDLVPDDSIGYRETLIRSFGRRRIYGEGTGAMTDDALAWNPPRMPLRLVRGLKIAQVAVSGGFVEPENRSVLDELVRELGSLLADPAVARETGLISVRDPAFAAESYSLPVIESIRIARRVGPDKQITFDLIAEITQERQIHKDGGASYKFRGGTTLIIDCLGEVRFSISKRVDHPKREETQWALIKGSWGAGFWEQAGSTFQPVANLSQKLCDSNNEEGS